MSRPVGVTASAVVAILGSLLALLVAGIMVATPYIAPPQSQPPNGAQFIIAAAGVFAALAAIGIWTSVGLFRLHSWARTSMLVFAGFLAAVSIFALMGTMAVPMPPEYTAATVRTFHRTIALMFGIPFVVGVWWLIQFNTQSTKAAFASPTAEAASLRPLSITIIAWASIVGAASCLLPMLAGMPAFLFGVNLNGWIAVAIYGFFGALSLYIGKGLLDLRERARLVAIGWFAFSLVHAGLVTLVPTLRQRLLESQRALTQNQPNPIPFDQGMMMNVIFAFAAIVAAVAIWFLIRNRGAFVRAGNSPSARTA